MTGALFLYEGVFILETEKIPIAEHLSDREYKFLLAAYAHHSSYMNVTERKAYTLSEMVKVEPCIRNESLKVYFNNGTCWYYLADGNWSPADSS